MNSLPSQKVRDFFFYFIKMLLKIKWRLNSGGHLWFTSDFQLVCRAKYNYFSKYVIIMQLVKQYSALINLNNNHVLASQFILSIYLHRCVQDLVY
jgi:hypothetical protein